MDLKKISFLDNIVRLQQNGDGTIIIDGRMAADFSQG
jgi:3-mercaptopyruvate sulfurtransferase SseA